MAPLLELQRDKTFRLQLMLACFTVAFLVSLIYIFIAYKLSTDLGIKIEKTSINRQAILLHAEIVEGYNQPESRLDGLIDLIYINDDFNAEKLYVEAYGSGLLWAFNHDISPYQLNKLKTKIQVASKKTNNEENSLHLADGIELDDGKHFLWQTVEGHGRKIIIIKVTSTIEEALALIVKRLSITFIIVLLLSATLAILLSSWMGRRVQSKNDELTKLAAYDQLTGLPNRLYLLDIMQQCIPKASSDNTKKSKKASQKHLNMEGCLFVIDLDKFKEVNDAFGHSSGDELLRKISNRISVVLGEKYTLARVGGDEFIAWAPEITIKSAISLAKELVAACNEPIMINQLAVNTGASIGVAHYPSHASDISSLILCADIAMYEAKQSRTGWSLFNERDTEANLQRLRLRADLTDALLNQEIHLYYQPKVMLDTGKIIGVEALSRWHHPTDGVLYPNSFIDTIEQSGRVQEFGRYVVRTAIDQLAEWQSQNIFTPIAVNLSPYNLLDIGLLNFTLKLLDEKSISPSMLEVELVESSTSINIEQISHLISKFKAAGIKISIDDFGTGMSSLSYISNLNVNLIKVDRAFIENINEDDKKQAIILTAIALASALNTKLLAEGIETQAQAELLMKMGCRYGQGYYYAKPMPADKATSLLLSRAHLPTEE